MATSLVKLSAFFISCAVSAVSVGEGSRAEDPLLDGRASRGGAIHPSRSDAFTAGEMSPEEKERRREVCARAYDACHDWCMRTKKTAKQQRFCLEEDCIPKLEDCMRAID